MALGDVIARLSVVLGMETAAFEQGATIAEKRIAQSQKRIEKFGDKIAGVGARLSVALSAPLAVLGKQAVDGFIEQEKALADVEAAIQSMGGASGKTTKQLARMADEMELRSLFDAEVILKQVSAQLLTFGNIAGEQFDRAQQAAIDMATRLGGEPQAAAIALGKALNDPVRGVTALTRVGVQFTESQKAQIEAMVAMGDTAGAQGVILAEVEKQFRGAAAAAADASPWRKAQVQIGQAMDAIGAAILPAIKPIADAVASVARAFASLPEPAQKAIVVVGVLAAALGPVLLVLGPLVSAMAPFLATLKAIGATQGILVAARAGLIGLATAAWPIAAAGAAAYLVWKNWDDIAPRLQPLIDQLTAIAVGLGVVEADSARTAETLKQNDGWRKFGEDLRSVSGFMQKLIDDLEASDDAFGAWAVKNEVTVAQLASRLWRAFSDMVERQEAWGRRVRAQFEEMMLGAINAVRNMVQGVQMWLQDRLGAVFDWVGRKTRQVSGFFEDMYIAVVGNSWVPDMVDGIAAHMNRLEAVMVAPAKAATGAVSESMRLMAAETQALLDRLFPEVRRLLDYRRDVALLDKAGLSPEQLEEARRRLGSEFSGVPGGPSPVLFEDPGKAIPAEVMRQQMEKFIEAMGGMRRKAEDHTVRIARSFKDMATETLAALDRMTSAIKGGGFLDILSAVLGLGLQLGSIGVFGKKVQGSINKSVPGYAVGTNSAARGLAMVGERGPELVSFRGGERVYTNAETRGLMGGRGGGNTYHFQGNLMTPEFWAQIQRGDQAAAMGGASMAAEGMARSRKWALA